MTNELPPDAPEHQPSDSDLLEAHLLASELQAHWEKPGKRRLRPIAIASAAALLQRLARTPPILPGFWSRLNRARAARPLHGAASAMDDAIEQLRASTDPASRREAALDVSALAYRLAESDDGRRAGTAPAITLSRRHAGLMEVLLDAIENPADLHRARAQRSDVLQSQIDELRVALRVTPRGESGVGANRGAA